MEILGITPVLATGFEAAVGLPTVPSAAFDSALAGMKVAAPPGAEPPPLPFKKAETGEEGATLEPIAPTQIPDFSPEQRIAKPIRTGSKPLDPVAGDTGPIEKAEVNLFDLTASNNAPTVQALALMGPITVPAVAPELKQVEGPVENPKDQPIKGSATPQIKVDLDGAKPTPRYDIARPTPVTGKQPNGLEKPEKADFQVAKPKEPLDVPTVDPTLARPTPPKTETVDRSGATPAPAEEVQRQDISRPDIQKLVVETTTKPEDKAIRPEPKPKEVKLEVDGARGVPAEVRQDVAKPVERSINAPKEEKEFRVAKNPKKVLEAEPAPKVDLKAKSEGAEPKPAENFVPQGADVARPTAKPVDATKPIQLSPKQADEVIRQVIDRVESLAASNPNQKVTIHLDPREFGSITLVVQRSGQEVDAELYASNDGVRQALDSGQKTLYSGLEQRGIHLGSMTVGSELPHGSGRQEQAMREMAHEARHFMPQDQRHVATTLSLDAMRALSRQAAGVDLWI